MPHSITAARVLLVDDEQMLRDLLTDVLSSLNLAVTAAADGEEALAALENGDGFDLIVTDVQMPGISGLEFARRARLSMPCVPVIFLSGFSALLNGTNLALGEHDRYLRKPFSLDSFEALIWSTLERADHTGCEADTALGELPTLLPVDPMAALCVRPVSGPA